jgi:hypothetical protein
VLALAATAGCASVGGVSPRLYEKKRLVIVSVHAQKAVDLSQNALMPGLLDNDYGEEVVAMTLADTEAALGDMFGVPLVPPGKAMETRAYRALPEALPAEDWSQAIDMLAVDVDHEDADATLAAVAREAGADAAVVLRNTWWAERDRADLSAGLVGMSIYNRCRIVVVGADGVRLWDDAVVVGAASPAYVGRINFSFNGAGLADDLRKLVRRTGQEALAALAERYQRGRQAPASAAPPPPATTTTPAPAG